MNNTRFIIFSIVFVLLILSIILIHSLLIVDTKKQTASNKSSAQPDYTAVPLSIAAMKARKYPGSRMTIEQTLTQGSNYDQYIASYTSDGLKLYGLLTIPQGPRPKTGWPVIIFNHGYIPPEEYQTTERYVAYVDAFARDGYIVFKPDYRGNGTSEGKPEGAYYSPAYATDVLNALASVKQLSDLATGKGIIADPNRIGMWGHSMGGNITLRDMVVRPQDIKAAVIWGGVVGSYEDLMHWHDPFYNPSTQERGLRQESRSRLIKQYGTPESNPSFWHAIDPTYFLTNISAPLQLHTGESDEEVPASFSASLAQKLKNAGKAVEFYEYPGADHNISQSFDLAMQRSVDFFDKYVKGGEKDEK
jgi:dipeptidyl aminopeptidase/acylaminoacyl peptidase